MDAFERGEAIDQSPQGTAEKQPRTERGRKTLRKLLDASAIEFGEKSFHDASVSSITRRAGVALGSFYTYFDSKEELFRALVRDLSSQVKAAAGEAIQALPDDQTAGPLEVEEAALESFLKFARAHKEVYRIIDESEFVDPDGFRTHYQNTAARIYDRLQSGAENGDLRRDIHEAHAWAIMGMNVFLGLRYAVWDQSESTAEIAEIAKTILRDGLTLPDT